jgi:hypothetical protein
MAKRPLKYTDELGREICERLAQVGSLRRVCRDEDMPHDWTVRKWLVDNEDFAAAYTRAKEAGIDALIDETLDLADEPAPSTAQGSTDSGHVAWNKVRIETRRWLAERMMPKRYGVRSATEITGADGGPVKTQVIVATGVPTSELPDIDQLV